MNIYQLQMGISQFYEYLKVLHQCLKRELQGPHISRFRPTLDLKIIQDLYDWISQYLLLKLVFTKQFELEFRGTTAVTLKTVLDFPLKHILLCVTVFSYVNHFTFTTEPLWIKFGRKIANIFRCRLTHDLTRNLRAPSQWISTFSYQSYIYISVFNEPIDVL